MNLKHISGRPIRWGVGSVVLMAAVFLSFARRQTNSLESLVAVTVSGGLDTDPRDGARPVALVAGALGVPSSVFRRAFSGVTPARGSEPEPGQVRRNKAALLSVLAPYAISNDQLDRASDYYRYRPEQGEIWPCTPAKILAIVNNGKLTGLRVIQAGAGYTTPPTLSVPGFQRVVVTAKLGYSKQFETNGSIVGVKVLHE